MVSQNNEKDAKTRLRTKEAADTASADEAELPGAGAGAKSLAATAIVGASEIELGVIAVGD